MTWIFAAAAHADGSAELGGDQAVRADTELHVDLLALTESVTWTGGGDVDVFDPGGTLVATLGSGDTYAPAVVGAHRVVLSQDEDTWDLAVSGAAPGRGRVWSYVWSLDGGTFAQVGAFDGSVYALVDGGGVDRDGVVELAADGFAGNQYTLQANRSGIPGSNGRSVAGQVEAPAEYPIYLLPPEIASYDPVAPTVAGFVYGAGSAGCDLAVPGLLTGAFTFDANVEGTYHVVCDLDDDGTFDITSDADVHLLGATVVGLNEVSWDGTDNVGDPVPAGAYACRVTVTVGEFHYVGQDIETSFEGFGLFSVDAALGRVGLPMYWNDTEVQGDEPGDMPNGDVSLASSGALGVSSGAYADPRSANVNARAWGSFQSQSKGNENTLDTYTWLLAALSGEVTVQVAGGDDDADGDGLGTLDERCELGTDPADADTDDDGLLDGTELGVTEPRLDTDLGVFVPDADPSTVTDPLDADTDGDGLLDGEEDADHDGASPATIGGTGTPGTGESDPLAADTDGDGLGDGAEAAGGTSPVDTDTDDGSVADGDEIANGTDPRDPLDDVPDPGDPPPEEPVSGRFYGGATCATAPGASPAWLLGLALLWRRRR